MPRLRLLSPPNIRRHYCIDNFYLAENSLLLLRDIQAQVQLLN